MSGYGSLEKLKRLSQSLSATLEILPETEKLRALSVREKEPALRVTDSN